MTPPSDLDSITQGNQDMFPLPWKNLKVGEKPNLTEMTQVSICKIDNRSDLEYIPPLCQGKVCTVVQPPWHLSGARADEGRGPPLNRDF